MILAISIPLTNHCLLNYFIYEVKFSEHILGKTHINTFDINGGTENGMELFKGNQFSRRAVIGNLKL